MKNRARRYHPSCIWSEQHSITRTHVCSLFDDHYLNISYQQADNTGKQNKSRFLFGYLGELLLSGVFLEIYVSFLPVGHTHEVYTIIEILSIFIL